MENKYYNHDQRTGKSWEVTKEEYESYRETWQIDKYYYPDVEDLRIGWEGEVNWSRAYSEEFEKYIIEIQDQDGTFLCDLEHATHALQDGYAQFRVPLFSQEQLAKEPGWYNVTDGTSRDWTFGGFFNAKNGTIYSAAYNVATFRPNSKLEIWDTNFAFLVYQGQCQDINDFRLICKLLRIH